MYGGKTVEVLNTDAEGRLVLADAIVRAAEDEPGLPDRDLDADRRPGRRAGQPHRRRSWAPTTSATASPELARATGEGGWAMPLPEELRGDLDSRLADLANVTGHRWGGMLVAGTSCASSSPDGLDWAHIDIAGPRSTRGSPWGYTGKGGTGCRCGRIAAVLADIADAG